LKKPKKIKTKSPSKRRLPAKADVPEGLVFFSLDTQFRYISFSPAHAATMKKIWGVDIRAGDSMLDFIPNRNDRQKARRNFARALTGKSFSVQEEYGDPRLLRTYYENRYTPLRAKNGAIRGLTVLVLDITELKQTERRYAESDERLRMALAAAQMGTWVWDIPTNRVTWSEEVYRIFGFQNKRSITFKAYQALIHPADRLRVSDQIEAALFSRSDYTIEHRILWPDGSVRWVEALGQAFYGKNGNPVRMTGTVRDITEKKWAEQERNQWKTRYELLAAATGDIVYDYDLPSGVIVWSASVISVLGYQPDEIGHLEHWKNLLHPADRAASVRALEEAQQNLKKYEVNYRMRHKQGHYVPLEDHGFFIAGDTGEATRMLGSMRDITQAVRSEQERRQLEMLYQTLFNSTPDAVMIFDGEGPDPGRMISANAAAARMHGYELDEFLTLHIRDLYRREDAEKLNGKLMRLLNGQKSTFIVEHVKKDGTVFTLEATKGMFELEGKRFVLAIDRDITERIKAEKALLESEQRFRRLQEASFGGIAIHDNGTIIDANQGLAQMSGYSLEELVGKNAFEIIAPEYRELVKKNVQSNHDQPYDIEAIRKDGKRVFIEAHGKTIPYRNQTLRVAEFRDITERKKSEQQIREQNARLAAIAQSLTRKNEQLKEFAQIVSHNLRAPAGNILSLAQMLESLPPAEVSELARLLQQAGHALLNSLHELNEALKIKQNKNIERQELHFETELNHVAGMLIAHIQETNAQLEVDCSAAPTVLFPKIYLESIFLNLLSNALKYRHPERPPRIRITTHRQDRLTVLTVADNGLGIDLKKYGHQVFKLYKTFHAHPESRGIGLFMVRNQIEAMGGEIAVDSEAGQGCVFTITFDKNPELED
jgi:PAS domain S-box-containing protein